MKKCLWILLVAFLLGGCAAEETFETISDELVQSVMAQPREISVRLPDDALAPVLGSSGQQVYLSENYEIILETMDSGDLNATVRTVSGYDKEKLTILETQQQDVTRYEFVWVSAGEEGERLGRGVILDDGNYHYCLSVLRDAADTEKSQIVWSDVFSSFILN